MSVADGLPSPQRGKAVLVIVLGIAMSVMDGSIVNLALPGIAREMNAPASQAIWVVNAYQIASLVMLLPLAALGDRLGYRRVYLVAWRCLWCRPWRPCWRTRWPAHGRARPARPGRRRHHEREHRAGAADLPSHRLAGALRSTPWWWPPPPWPGRGAAAVLSVRPGRGCCDQRAAGPAHALAWPPRTATNPPRTTAGRSFR